MTNNDTLLLLMCSVVLLWQNLQLNQLNLSSKASVDSDARRTVCRLESRAAWRAVWCGSAHCPLQKYHSLRNRGIHVMQAWVMLLFYSLWKYIPKVQVVRLCLAVYFVCLPVKELLDKQQTLRFFVCVIWCPERGLSSRGLRLIALWELIGRGPWQAFADCCPC